MIEYITDQLLDITALNPWNGDINTIANGMIIPIVSLNADTIKHIIATISVITPKSIETTIFLCVWLNKAKAEQYNTYIIVIDTVNRFISPLAPLIKSPTLHIIEIITTANRQNTEKTLSVILDFIPTPPHF